MSFLLKHAYIRLKVGGFLLGLLVMPFCLKAQNTIYFGAGYEEIYPLGKLHDRFIPIEAPVFLGGWDLDAQSRILLDYRFMCFDEINRDKLPYDSLSMKLTNYSAGLTYSYTLWQPAKWFLLSVQAGVSLNQWNFTRDAFHGVIPDSLNPQTLDLESHKRSDWSWGCRVGCGVEFSPLSFLHLGWHANFHLIAAELWPAESLGMESVSGLKMVNHHVYVKMSYGW
ncbi:MAG: hypothetical protein PHS99_00905 [Candidatus Marinimicrobia bacterium]|nr:hypothetical protein [Candidatus Neomarinimicrobiota bacterium]